MPIEFENSPEYDLHSSIQAAPIIELYQTEHQILSGELSSVYIVRNRFTGERYTLKAIRKSEGITFDFDKLIKLKHENIVTMASHYETERYHYIIKPYIEGIDLHRYISIHGPLDSKKANALTKQLISAFKYLHDRKEPLIFRDLKPSNIIIEEALHDRTFSITLIDIETMRQRNDTKRADTYYVLSHGYTSPEQYGYRQTDVRSDIFSLGATLFFAITGTEPSIKENIAKKCHEKNPKIDRRLKLAIERSLAFDPENRYKDIYAFERALKHIDYMPLIRKNSIALAALLILPLGISFTFSLENLRDFNWFNANQTVNTQSEIQNIQTALTLDLPRPFELITVSENTSVLDSTVETVDVPTTLMMETSTEPQSVVSQVTQPEIQMKIEATTEGALQHSTQPITTTQSPAIEITETATENSATPTQYYKEEELIASKNGVYVTQVADKAYTIWVDRKQLPELQERFVYISVFSYLDYNSDSAFPFWSQNAIDKGHGFQVYSESHGYGSYNDLHHFVVFLYDANKTLVGTIDFKNIR